MTKTVLITGSTDGIGLLTAQMLAAQGHKVILHGRNAAKLEAAAQQVGDVAGSFEADLSSLEATQALADTVIAAHGQIDILINNAGVLKAPEPVLSNGKDIRFVVNTLAPHVLTQALLPALPQDGRVITLSSAAQATVDLQAMSGQRRLADMEAYSQSKRAVTLWSAEMAEAHPEGPVFISVNPGSLLASKMVKEGFGIAGNDLRIGAEILCRLALEDSFATASGQYWDNDAGQFGQVEMSQAKEVLRSINELTR